MYWRFPLAALLCVGSFAHLCVAAPPATQPSATEMMQRKIQDLQTRIDRLEADRAEANRSRPQADPEEAMHSIIVDADDQIPLPASAYITAGYDPKVGFILQSDDGNFSMHPSLLLQARYTVNDRNHIVPGEGGITAKQGDDVENGFQIARFRFSLDGNVVTPLLNYYVLIAQDPEMPHTTLLDAYLTYRESPQSPVALKVGQFKDPVWHEQNLLPSRLMAVDRSLVNDLIGGGQTDRIQGGAVVFDQERLRGILAVHDGYNGGNSAFYGPSGSGDIVGAGAGLAPTDWGVSGRGEYLFVGAGELYFNPYYEYDQFSARGDKQNMLVLGSGFDYSESGADKILFHTLDAQFNTNTGLAFYGAYLGAYRNLYTNRGVAPGSYYDSGILFQSSCLIADRVEPFFRYDYTHLDGNAEPGVIQDNITEVTIGANYYLFGQQAKITVDGTWLPDGCPTDVPYLDILQDNSHNEFLLRAQFQVGF